MTPAAGTPLRLRAADGADLEVISACLQDAVVAVRDLAFRQQERRFVLVASRFRWEASRRAGGAGHERVLCGVSFENVDAVRRRNVDPGDRDRFLDLLHVRLDRPPGPGPGAVDLTFAGDAAIRLEIGALACRVEDFGDAWPTVWCPDHGDA